MNIRWMIYQQLELIPDTVPEPKPPRSAFLGWIQQKWRSFMAVIEHHNQPIIWRSQNELGATCWNVYEPSTGRTYYMTGDEFQTWFERRYGLQLSRNQR